MLNQVSGFSMDKHALTNIDLVQICENLSHYNLSVR